MKALVIVLAVLFLAGQIRVGGLAEYGAGGFSAWIRLGKLHVKVFPPGAKAKPRKKKERKTGGSGEGPKKPETALPDRPGGALDYARTLLPVALEAAEHMYSKIRMDTLELELTVGAADPADAAMRYGQASGVLGAFWYPLTQAFHVKDGHARVLVDFDGGETAVYGRASLSIKIGQMIWLGLYFGCRALRGILAVRGRQKRQRKAA